MASTPIRGIPARGRGAPPSRGGAPTRGGTGPSSPVGAAASSSSSPAPVAATVVHEDFDIDFEVEKEMRLLREVPDVEQEEQELTMMLVKFKQVADGGR